MGLIYLYGLGVDIDVMRAYDHFVISENDHRSLNALGYIYATAPKLFDTSDPVRSKQYGSITNDMKKDEKYFLQAS